MYILYIFIVNIN